MIFGSVEGLSFLHRTLNGGFFSSIFSEILMNIATIFLVLVYTYVILSLIWARLSFFKVKSTKARLSALLYDPVVLIHIGLTYLHIFETNSPPLTWAIILACLIYIGALLLFWWGINTAKGLNFAFGSFSGQIISSGPFRFSRHPFYLSYTLIWATSTLLFNSPALWITLFYLVVFYLSSAKSEEKAILSSEQADQYRTYCSKTNMFIPRIQSWKN